MLDVDEVRQAVRSLRGVLAAVEAGEVECEPAQLAHLRGAVDALEQLVTPNVVRDTSV